jgi:hypothetical protein
MSEINDIRKLMNILNEGNITVPGIGVYSDESLRKNLLGKLKSLVEMAEKGNWNNIEYHLYKAGAFETMLKAYIEYDNAYEDAEIIPDDEENS